MAKRQQGEDKKKFNQKAIVKLQSDKFLRMLENSKTDKGTLLDAYRSAVNQGVGKEFIDTYVFGTKPAGGTTSADSKSYDMQVAHSEDSLAAQQLQYTKSQGDYARYVNEQKDFWNSPEFLSLVQDKQNDWNHFIGKNVDESFAPVSAQDQFRQSEYVTSYYQSEQQKIEDSLKANAAGDIHRRRVLGKNEGQAGFEYTRDFGAHPDQVYLNPDGTVKSATPLYAGPDATYLKDLQDIQRLKDLGKINGWDAYWQTTQAKWTMRVNKAVQWLGYTSLPFHWGLNPNATRELKLMSSTASLVTLMGQKAQTLGILPSSMSEVGKFLWGMSPLSLVYNPFNKTDKLKTDSNLKNLLLGSMPFSIEDRKKRIALYDANYQQWEQEYKDTKSKLETLYDQPIPLNRETARNRSFEIAQLKSQLQEYEDIYEQVALDKETVDWYEDKGAAMDRAWDYHVNQVKTILSGKSDAPSTITSFYTTIQHDYLGRSYEEIAKEYVQPYSGRARISDGEYDILVQKQAEYLKSNQQKMEEYRTNVRKGRVEAPKLRTNAAKLYGQGKYEEALKLIEQAQEYDRLDVVTDMTQAYTFNYDPARREKFLKQLAWAELQKGDKLNQYEIMDIQSYYVDPFTEFSADIFFDAANLIPGAILEKALKPVKAFAYSRFIEPFIRGSALGDSLRLLAKGDDLTKGVRILTVVEENGKRLELSGKALEKSLARGGKIVGEVEQTAESLLTASKLYNTSPFKAWETAKNPTLRKLARWAVTDDASRILGNVLGKVDSLSDFVRGHNLKSMAKLRGSFFANSFSKMIRTFDTMDEFRRQLPTLVKYITEFNNADSLIAKRNLIRMAMEEFKPLASFGDEKAVQDMFKMLAEAGRDVAGNIPASQWDTELRNSIDAVRDSAKAEAETMVKEDWRKAGLLKDDNPQAFAAEVEARVSRFVDGNLNNYAAGEFASRVRSAFIKEHEVVQDVMQDTLSGKIILLLADKQTVKYPKEWLEISKKVAKNITERTPNTISDQIIYYLVNRSGLKAGDATARAISSTLKLARMGRDVWTRFVLHLNPRWIVQNVIDSYHRLLVTGPDSMNYIFTSTANLLDELENTLGYIPLELQSLGRDDVSFYDSVIGRIIRNRGELGDPYKYEFNRLSTQAEYIEKINAANGVFMNYPNRAKQAASLRFNALVNSAADINTAIEFNARIRLLVKEYNKVISKFDPQLFNLTAKNADPALKGLMRQIWEGASGDPRKISAVVENLFGEAAKTSSRYSLLVPPGIETKLDALMSPEERSLFVRDITNQLTDMIKNKMQKGERLTTQDAIKFFEEYDNLITNRLQVAADARVDFKQLSDTITLGTTADLIDPTLTDAAMPRGTSREVVEGVSGLKYSKRKKVSDVINNYKDAMSELALSREVVGNDIRVVVENGNPVIEVGIDVYKGKPIKPTKPPVGASELQIEDYNRAMADYTEMMANWEPEKAVRQKMLNATIDVYGILARQDSVVNKAFKATRSGIDYRTALNLLWENPTKFLNEEPDLFRVMITHLESEPFYKEVLESLNQKVFDYSDDVKLAMRHYWAGTPAELEQLRSGEMTYRQYSDMVQKIFNDVHPRPPAYLEAGEELSQSGARLMKIYNSPLPPEVKSELELFMTRATNAQHRLSMFNFNSFTAPESQKNSTKLWDAFYSFAITNNKRLTEWKNSLADLVEMGNKYGNGDVYGKFYAELVKINQDFQTNFLKEVGITPNFTEKGELLSFRYKTPTGKIKEFIDNSTNPLAPVFGLRQHFFAPDINKDDLRLLGSLAPFEEEINKKTLYPALKKAFKLHDNQARAATNIIMKHAEEWSRVTGFSVDEYLLRRIQINRLGRSIEADASLELARGFPSTIRGANRRVGDFRFYGYGEKNITGFLRQNSKLLFLDLKDMAVASPGEYRQSYTAIRNFLQEATGLAIPAHGELLPEHQKLFADLYLKYFKDGEAPVKGLKTAFSTISKNLSVPWNDIVRSGIVSEIPDDVYDVMSKVYAGTKLAPPNSNTRTARLMANSVPELSGASEQKILDYINDNSGLALLGSTERVSQIRDVLRKVGIKEEAINDTLSLMDTNMKSWLSYHPNKTPDDFWRGVSIEYKNKDIKKMNWGILRQDDNLPKKAIPFLPDENELIKNENGYAYLSSEHIDWLEESFIPNMIADDKKGVLHGGAPTAVAMEVWNNIAEFPQYANLTFDELIKRVTVEFMDNIADPEKLLRTRVMFSEFSDSQLLQVKDYSKNLIIHQVIDDELAARVTQLSENTRYAYIKSQEKFLQEIQAIPELYRKAKSDLALASLPDVAYVNGLLDKTGPMVTINELENILRRSGLDEDNVNEVMGEFSNWMDRYQRSMFANRYRNFDSRAMGTGMWSDEATVKSLAESFGVTLDEFKAMPQDEFSAKWNALRDSQSAQAKALGIVDIEELLNMQRPEFEALLAKNGYPTGLSMEREDFVRGYETNQELKNFLQRKADSAVNKTETITATFNDSLDPNQPRLYSQEFSNDYYLPIEKKLKELPQRRWKADDLINYIKKNASSRELGLSPVMDYLETKIGQVVDLDSIPMWEGRIVEDTETEKYVNYLLNDNRSDNFSFKLVLDDGKYNFSDGHYKNQNIVSSVRGNYIEENGRKIMRVQEVQSDWAKLEDKGDVEFVAALRLLGRGGEPTEADIMKFMRDFPLQKTWSKTSIRSIIRKAIQDGADEVRFVGDARLLQYIENWGIAEFNSVALTRFYEKEIPSTLKKLGLEFKPIKVDYDVTNEFQKYVEITKEDGLVGFGRLSKVEVEPEFHEFSKAFPVYIPSDSLTPDSPLIKYTNSTFTIKDREMIRIPSLQEFIDNNQGYFGDYELVDYRNWNPTPQVQQFTWNSVELTPELKKSLNAPIPLFQKQSTIKGAYWRDYNNGGAAQVALFQKADVSTVIHEWFGHASLDRMHKMSSVEKLDEAIKHVETLKKWVGLDPNDSIGALQANWEEYNSLLRMAESSGEPLLYVQQQQLEMLKPMAEKYIKMHEMYAEGAVRYFRSGRAPTPELKSIFANMKKWLGEIWRNLKFNYLTAENLPADVIKMYDFMLLDKEGGTALARTLDGQYLKSRYTSLEDVPVEIMSAAFKQKIPSEVRNAADEHLLAWKSYTMHYNFNGFPAPALETPDTFKAYLKEAIGKSTGRERDMYMDMMWRVENFQEKLNDFFYGMDFKSHFFPEMSPISLDGGTEMWIKSRGYVRGEYEKMKDILDDWQEYMVKYIENDGVTVLPKTTRDEMMSWAKSASSAKASLTNSALHGGDIVVDGTKLGTETGALNIVNDVMLDYDRTSQFDTLMSNIYPFWKFPSRSWEFWAKTLPLRPSLIALYEKVQKLSRMQSLQAGAINSQGNQLESMRGYVRIPGTDSWFNPMAALSFRYILNAIEEPRNPSFVNEQADAAPSTFIFNEALKSAPTYGLYPAMWWQFIATQLEQTGMLPGFTPSDSFPIIPAFSLIPPWAVEEIAFKMGRPINNNWLNPRASYSDYLVERKILADAYAKIKEGKLSDSEQRALLSDATEAIKSKERNKLWLDTRKELENDASMRSGLAYFTGLYAKPFDDKVADLIRARNEVNALKSALNNEAQAAMFNLDDDPITRTQNFYKQYGIETPEGWIHRLYGDISWVQSPQDVDYPMQERAKALATMIEQDELRLQIQSDVYKAKEQLNKALMKYAVGTPWELYSQEYDDYWAQYEDIQAAAPDYTYFGTNASVASIEQKVRNRWWKAIESTRPNWNKEGGESFENYELRVAKWEEQIPDIAKTLAKSFLEAEGHNKAYMDEIVKYLDTNQQAFNPTTLVQRLVSSSNLDEYGRWRIENDTVFDALNAAWKELYANPYKDTVNQFKPGDYERTIAEQDFFSANPAPTAEQLYQWIASKYGDRFTREEIMDWVNVGKPATGDSLNIMQSNELRYGADWTKLQEVYTMKAWAGAGQLSYKFEEVMQTVGQLKGYTTTEIAELNELLYEDSSYFLENPEKLKILYDVVSASLSQLNIGQPSREMLILYAEAQNANDRFKEMVTLQLGQDFYKNNTEYNTIRYDDRIQNRKQQLVIFEQIHPEFKKQLSEYRQMQKTYASQNPLWGQFYYYAKVTKSAQYKDYNSTITSLNTTGLKMPDITKAPSAELPPKFADVVGQLMTMEVRGVLDGTEALSPQAKKYLIELKTRHPEWAGFIDKVLAN